MPTGKLDFDKIKKLAAANKTIPEIIKETGYNPASVRSAIIRLGLKCKDARGGINAKPAIPSPSSILGIDASNKEKSPSRKIGTCRNCKRERWIQGNGLDTGCFNRVKDLTPGTPEYTSALAKAKEDFNNPEYRSDRGWQNRRGKNPDKKKAEKKNQYNWHVKESHEQGTMSESSDKFKRRFKKSVTPADSMFKIREAENINIISLSVLIAERNMHQACVFKLNKAIEALQ